MNIPVTAHEQKIVKDCFEILEKERQDLAHELHDDIGQSLTAIRTSAKLIARQSEGRQSHAVAEGIVELTDHMFELLHGMLHRLHPTVLDKLGLEDALTDLAEFGSKHFGLTCNVHINGDIEGLDMPLKMTIYRVVQECLTNATRHGTASKAEVRVSRYPDRIDVSVLNNGKPIIESRLDSPGMGILGMKKRIEAFDGEISLGNSTNGVLVEATLPMQEES
jgi:two-component system sensor histidine kinase UhpB